MSFERPALTGAIGEPGARDLHALFDDQGRAVVAGWIAGVGRAHLQILEEGEGGIFASHDPSALVPDDAVYAEIVKGHDGSLLAAWQQGKADATFVYTATRDPSGIWTDPQGSADTLSFPPTAYQPRLAVASTGEVILVWDQWMSTGYGVSLATRASPSAPWALPSDADDVLSPHVFFSNAPTPAAGNDGAVAVTWYQSNGGPLMTYMSERKKAGDPFSKPGADDFISAPGAPIDSHQVNNPKPAFGPSGELAVAWTQEDGAGSIPVYLASRSPGGAMDSPLGLDDAFSPPLGVARCVQLAFGPKGDLYVIWYQDYGDGHRVLAARRRPDGTWAESGRTPQRLSGDGAIGIFPSIAVGPDGGVIAVWVESDGGPFRVWARRTGSADEPWGPAELLSPEGGDASSAAAVVGPGDRAFVTWVQGEGLSGKVMIARAYGGQR